MKFPAGLVLQVAENELRAWLGMREAICCLRAVNMSIVAQRQVGVAMVYTMIRAGQMERRQWRYTGCYGYSSPCSRNQSSRYHPMHNERGNWACVAHVDTYSLAWIVTTWTTELLTFWWRWLVRCFGRAVTYANKAEILGLSHGVSWIRRKQYLLSKQCDIHYHGLWIFLHFNV